MSNVENLTGTIVEHFAQAAEKKMLETIGQCKSRKTPPGRHNAAYPRCAAEDANEQTLPEATITLH
ncbi:hypothetical protein T12_2454 [Trichinella patagoniensis]|uniref:Uncharacterized protein n=1 Tax=Trichinella patagoniensis TaxID=990121 RepID=A0A0V0ZGG0_9BILA|nr:hypothetical protein T12_2454 [Trichinella patagoniensis]